MNKAHDNNGETANGNSTTSMNGEGENGSPQRANQNGDACHEAVPAENGNSVFQRVFRRGRVALEMLCEAALYAQDVDRRPWDFSLEIGVLRDSGLGDSDLRWLLCKGFLEHALEVKSTGSHARRFEPTTSLSFCRNSCFVLTQSGQDLACQELNERIRAHEELELDKTLPQKSPAEVKPYWDRDRQELRVGPHVVKQFKVPAANQEVILAAFQEENWPPRIDDPLPPHRDLEPKRRLQDTIISLNRNHKTELLRFFGDGTGQSVCWEFIKQMS